MKITKRQLRRIIKEEKAKLVKEAFGPPPSQASAVQEAWHMIEGGLNAAMDSGALDWAAFREIEKMIKGAIDPNGEYIR